MNEQAINNIITYFQQYPDTPAEQLVQNILQTSYKMPDLVEALRRQGISPIVIPGYQEPPPAPEPVISRKIIYLSAGIFVSVLVIGIIVFFLLTAKKSEKKEELSGQVQQGVINMEEQKPTQAVQTKNTPAPTINPAPQISDEYEVQVLGNVLVDLQDKQSRHTGFTDASTEKKDIPNIEYAIQDNKSGAVDRYIYQTQISKLTSTISEFFDINLQFRDTNRTVIKIITHDTSIKTASPSANRKRMVIYHNIKEEKGRRAKIHFVLQSEPSTLNLTVTDASGSAFQSIAPTFILNSVESQDVTPPVTTLQKGLEGGKMVLKLQATDENSGIYQTEYSLDGGKTVLMYKDPIVIDSSITANSIDFTSTDRAGNNEGIVRESF